MVRNSHRRRPALGLALAATLLFGCESGGDTGPVEPPDPPVPTMVAVRPESAMLTALGDGRDLTAEVADQHGAAMPSATVTWRSDDGGVVTVQSTGALTARAVAAAPGETRVVATAGSATASVAVAVEQIPASLETEGESIGNLPPATPVRISAGVRDGNEYPVPGARVVLQVEEGGGTVAPESVVTNAEGRAEATWTLGTSGAQALSVTAGAVSARFLASLCDPVVLDPGLRLGEPRIVTDSDIGCGVSVEAPEVGAYYRFTLAGTSPTRRTMDSVALSVLVGGASAGARRDFTAAGRETPPALDAATDPHEGRAEHNQRVLSWIARSDGPDPLSDLRATRSGRRDEPPEKREFTLGSPGTIEDNCMVAERVTGVRLAYNDHIAIYADETLSPPVSAIETQLLADYYRDFGAPTLQAYFGGVGDVDGDGRILAFVQDLSAFRVAAWVWVGDLLAKEDCPASNEAELMRIHSEDVRPDVIFNTTGTIVHEAKHISSQHQLVRRASDRGQSPFDVDHPFWMEEGTAEIAMEISARLGWESIGGPPPGAMVRGSDLRRRYWDIWTPEAHGVQAVLEKYGRVLASQPNSVTEHDPYGAGWGFFRFLGDWFGGAGSRRLGDAAMFARLNDAAVSEGLDGTREVTGRSFEELMVAYAQAVSLAGTGSPDVAGVPRFSTYDMTGLNRAPFSILLEDGRFPYPVTIRGSGSSATLWLPLAEPITITGLIGPNGFRIHDFRAERAGDRATIRVDVPAHVRLVVTRIPDQR